MGAFDPEPFEPVAPGLEPPEGDVELALQEEALDTEGVVAPDDALVPLGRTPAYDFERRCFLPAGRSPLYLYGLDALRQNIEKALRTERGMADVHSDDYGFEGLHDLIDGNPFDASAFAEVEQRTRDALLALPRVLDVVDFNAEYAEGDDAVFVTFRVVPEGDDLDPIRFERVPLPVT